MLNFLSKESWTDGWNYWVGNIFLAKMTEPTPVRKFCPWAYEKQTPVSW